MKRKQAIIYARYSSDLQKERSIDDQIVYDTGGIEREGWELVDVFVDAARSGAAGLSASGRPGMAALLARVAKGDIDFVVVDTTSRIARNQGDAHHFRDHLAFHGCALFSMADGIIDHFKGAIKGLIDEQGRREIAQNIKRAQVGRVAEGRSPAGLAYGYTKANRLSSSGELIRGYRVIDPEKAPVVVRFFEGYAAGKSARDLAAEANRAGIPGPRGGKWTASVILGGAKRGDGILRNRLYAGELVHGRTSKLIEPVSRSTRIRPNDPGQWATAPVPELRIVEANLFDTVQRQLAARATDRPEGERRPKRLLSGVGRCGVCGSGWIVIRTGFWGCGGVRSGKGCTNTRIISELRYNERVLGGLREQLLTPEAVDLYVSEYQAERTIRDREAGQQRRDLERKIQTETGRINRLINAIADGRAAISDICDRLKVAEHARSECRQRLASLDDEQVVLLHPAIAQEYRKQIERLHEAIGDDETGKLRDEVMPQLRALIDDLVVNPAPVGRGVAISVTGRLAQIIELATGRKIDASGMLTLERVKGIEPSS